MILTSLFFPVVINLELMELKQLTHSPRNSSITIGLKKTKKKVLGDKISNACVKSKYTDETAYLVACIDT